MAGDVMGAIFCARRADNPCRGPLENGLCESRTHYHPGHFAFHDQQPRCNICGRYVMLIYSAPWSMLKLDKNSMTVVHPDGREEIVPCP
jgi:hypothetical protein